MPGRVGDVELEEIAMKKVTITSNQKNIKWKLFLGISICILFLFWVGVLTDYSWFDDRVHIGYSILVLCASVAVLFLLRFLRKLLLIPILLICILSFLVALASILLHRYHSTLTPIQVTYSPDGTKFAEVYCEFTNAHTNGFDHIEIIMRYTKLPFLQRDLGLYNDEPRHCNFDTNVLVRWEDNNTIYVIERQANLSVDTIKGEGSLFDPGEIDGTH